MKIEQILFPHHQRTVHAIAYRPESDQPVPCVIICHGYNGFQDNTDVSARYMAEHGITAISITFCGGSTRDTSGFATTSMTLQTERDDILAVVEAEKKDPSVSCVFLHGESMGGMACVLASAIARNRIAGISLLYPALCIADDWRKKYPRLEDIPEVTDFWKMKLGREFFTSIHNLDIFSVLPAYQGPVLLMHGDADPIVPIDYSKKAAGLYQDVQFTAFSGEGHGFSSSGKIKVNQLLLSFIKQHC